MSTPISPPAGGHNGQDCASLSGSQALLCLIANPYASSVSRYIGYAIRKVADTLLYLAERDRRLRRFGLLCWVDVPDNLFVLFDETP